MRCKRRLFAVAISFAFTGVPARRALYQAGRFSAKRSAAERSAR
jgi:hypothetical protein